MKITRESCKFDSKRRYKVMIDDSCIGSICNGETKTFDLSQGNHELFLKIDWCRSQKIVVFNDDELICYPKSHIKKSTVSFLNFITSVSDYIILYKK